MDYDRYFVHDRPRMWEDWSSDDHEDDGTQQHLVRERRQYKIFQRVHLDKWDDVDFRYRFRVSKTTFAVVLEKIRSRLDYDDPR